MAISPGKPSPPGGGSLLGRGGNLPSWESPLLYARATTPTPGSRSGILPDRGPKPTSEMWITSTEGRISPLEGRNSPLLAPVEIPGADLPEAISVAALHTFLAGADEISYLCSAIPTNLT
jgi:hypothetical protein